MLNYQAALAALLTLAVILGFMLLSHLPGRQVSKKLTVREANRYIPPPPILPPQSTPPPSQAQASKPKLSTEPESFPLSRPQLALQPTLRSLDQIKVSLAGFNLEQESQAPKVDGFALDQLDRVPQLLNRPTAQFPQQLARRGITQGRVLLEVRIDRQGKVSVQRVLESSEPELEKPAIIAAQQARFETPQKDGLPVEALFQWPLILEQ